MQDFASKAVGGRCKNCAKICLLYFSMEYCVPPEGWDILDAFTRSKTGPLGEITWNGPLLLLKKFA